MKKYKIAITETLRKIVEVKEENPSQAVSKVESRYDLEEIVLTYEEHCDTTIALSVTDKLFREYQKKQEFHSFVDARLKEKLPKLDMEEKVMITFGSPEDAIADFENHRGESGKESVYLLYTCDAWHSNDSRQLVAPFSSKEAVYRYLEKSRKKYRLSDWDMEFFKENDQTQHGDENLIMESYEIDPGPEEENLGTSFYNKAFSSGKTQLARRELEDLPCPFCTKDVSDEVMLKIVSEADTEIKKWDYDDNNEELEFKYEDIRFREIEEAAVRHKVPYYEDLD